MDSRSSKLISALSIFPLVVLIICVNNAINRHSGGVVKRGSNEDALVKSNSRYTQINANERTNFYTRQLHLINNTKMVPNAVLFPEQSFDSKAHSVVFVESNAPSEAEEYINDCIATTSIQNGIRLSPRIQLRDRLLRHGDVSFRGQGHDLESDVMFHRGPYSFGACPLSGPPCGHFMILEDPLIESMAMYKKCRNDKDGKLEMCSGINAKKLDFRNFTTLYRYNLLNKLLFPYDLCVNPKASAQIFHVDLKTHKNLPCWLKTKMYLEHTFSADQLESLAVSVADRLKYWFVFLGLNSDIQTGIKMLDKTFKMSFTDCTFKAFNSKAKLQDNKIDKRSNRIHRRSSAERRRINQTNSVTNQNKSPQDSSTDMEEIKEILKIDYIIYNEAKRIYHVQKQIITNKL